MPIPTTSYICLANSGTNLSLARISKRRKPGDCWRMFIVQQLRVGRNAFARHRHSLIAP